MPLTYRAGFTEDLRHDPNMRFMAVLMYFQNEFGYLDETEIEKNRIDMLKPKIVVSGFKALQVQIEDGLAFAAFEGKTITVEDALNMSKVCSQFLMCSCRIYYKNRVSI